MNVELLLKVKNQILCEPSQFTMMFFEFYGIRCILGWAVHLADLSNEYAYLFQIKHMITEASYVLDISVEQCYLLGYIERWPEEFRNAYKNVDGETEVMQRTHARIAGERIDHFIKTEGRE